jgi:putative DNA primase/helicase
MSKPLSDFNDMKNLDAVRLQIESAAPVVQDAAGGVATVKPMVKPAEKNIAREVTFIQGCTVQPENISWAWNGWLPLGKLVIFAGQPGTGKTTVMLAIATVITIGGRLPDGTEAEMGSVVIWSGEDGISDTLVPRLIAMGADMSKIYFISGSDGKPFYPDQDMLLLAEKMKTVPDAKLVIIDPVVSAIGGDSHKNAEVRRGLQPLVDLGRDTGACIVGISHFNKSGGNTSTPLDLISGSIAFAAVARVVLGASKLNAPDPEHGHSRIFCRIKSNIGPDEDGIGYDLCMEPLAGHPDMKASTVLWGQYITGHSRDLLSQAAPEDNMKADNKLTIAVDWLTEVLSLGPVESKIVKEDAEVAAVSWATVRRAKKSLKVIDYKEPGKGGRWKWRLPTEEERQPKKRPWLIGTIEDVQVTCSNSVTNEQEHLEQHEQHDDSNPLNLLNLSMIKGEEIMSKLPDEAPPVLFEEWTPEEMPDVDC